jgi:tRNA/tmRNA/rRNA uracil-C5-methylase (TrmA/RlmC/RlmD family)
VNGPDRVDGPELGEVVELEVGAVAHGGHCVARLAGRVVFVRHTLPGERVRAVITDVRRDYLRADAVTVLVSSPHRVDPPCPYAGPDRCGGCDFQHVEPAAQRELKGDVVREQLTRLAGLTAAEVDELGVRVRALPGGPLGWRSRVQYTVDAAGRAGFTKHRSHEVVPVERCLIAQPAIQTAPVTGEVWWDVDRVEVIASTGGDFTTLSSLGQERPVVVSGPDLVRERAVGREWSLRAESFWQVHPDAADTFAATVVNLLNPQPGERVWDLYGGAGLFAAAVAPAVGMGGRVTVVEADARAAAAARAALRDLTWVRVITAPVERALRGSRRAVRLTGQVDLVVLDPPRSGAGRTVIGEIVSRRPRAVAYVACDPAALARDVRTCRDLGWRLAALRTYDAFPMTHHVECIALLLPG